MKLTTGSFARLTLSVAAAVMALAASSLAGTPVETVIYDFTPASSNPLYGLAADSSGNLFGTTSGGTATPLGSVFELSPKAAGGWTYTTLVTFDGSNGNLPQSSMVLDSQGNLYGSTVSGGSGTCTNGCGVVFELSPAAGGAWTYSVLYHFQGGNDGSSPEGNLVLDNSGNLYGTTGPSGSGSASNGTVFRLKPPAQLGGAWTEQTLHRFNGTDGFAPNSLALKDGALYGTANEGGTSFQGVVFQLKPINGLFVTTDIYSFSDGADGAFPFSVIGGGAPGVLYGTASQGGQFTWGNVFRLTRGSDGTWTESVLYDFTGGADGGRPYAPLSRDNSDNLYGTTSTGGLTSECSTFYPNDGCGVAFKVAASSGTETVLHAFSDADNDGNLPTSSGLVSGKGGAFYGTTQFGGSGGCVAFNGTVANCGTIYKIAP